MKKCSVPKRDSKPGFPGGSSSYGGYEYQISVTVWVGLDLLLVRGSTEALTIEPGSQEDVQACLKVDPDAASVDLRGVGRDYELALQVKSRSTGPWSARSMAEVLVPRAVKPGRSGPAPRQSPLERLARNEHARYMFVTNEGLQSSLYPHRAQSLFDWPDAQTLPPVMRQCVSDVQATSIAGRIAFCSGITFEVLEARIRNVLSGHGHVPLAEQDSCIRQLKDEVRERLLGHAGGLWTQNELIGTLISHHGSMLPTRVMDHYVPPSSFEAIRRALFENHAVVIAGPPGTGKTLTADVLEHMLRQSSTPFSVIGEERGPGYVRAQLARPDPILFHLRDPWGGNQVIPGADRWTNELPKLLEHRSANRKFLITSRSDVLHSAGRHLEPELRPYIVTLEVEHYGRRRLEDIYERRCGDLPERLRTTAQACRGQVLEVLKRPFEVDRFFAGLARDSSVGSIDSGKLIADSQLAAVSRVVANQVLGRVGGVECAAFLWGVLWLRTSIAEEMVPKLRRQMRQIDPSLRLEVESFVDFLIAGRNLRRAGATLSFYHPQVRHGLQVAIEEQPETAEIVLSRLCEALVASHAQWGLDTILVACRAANRLKGVQLELAATTRQKLDTLLLAHVSSAGPYQVEPAFEELALFGSVGSGPSDLARVLVNSLHKRHRPRGGQIWCRPTLSEAQWRNFLGDAATAELARRFVTSVLPFTYTRYPGGIIPFLARLCPALRDAYWQALKSVTEHWAKDCNLKTIISGACGSDTGALDEAVELLARAEEERDRIIKELLAELEPADELEAHQWEGDANADQLGYRISNNGVAKGLEAVIRIRSRTEGFGWIQTHPHCRLLIPALAAVFRGRRSKHTVADLRMLVQAAQIGQRGLAWGVAAEHWDSSLEDLYAPEIRRADLTDAAARQALVRIARLSAADSDQWILKLSQLTRTATKVRRLELIQDVANTSFADTSSDMRLDSGSLDPAGLRNARALADTYEEPLRELALALFGMLDKWHPDEFVLDFPIESENLLAGLLPELTESLAALLLPLAAALGIDPIPTVRRLLGSTYSGHAVVAVQTLATLSDSTSKAELLDIALRHDRYVVRRAVLTYLAAHGEAPDRENVLAMAKDRSAGVRLEFAEQMGQRCWPEALGSLVDLLLDARDFSKKNFSSPQPFQAEYNVARVAAKALGRYEALPERAVTALIERVNDAMCDDPIVGCNALDALTRRDDPRVTPLLLIALERPDLEWGPFLRPLSECASWGLLDRALADMVSLDADQYQQLVRAACTDPLEIAVPLLLTLQLLDRTDALRLAGELQNAGKSDRAELLRGQLDVERFLIERGMMEPPQPQDWLDW